MAYATLEDLEARRGVLDPDEREKAAALLDDAAVILDGLVTVDGSEEQETLLMIVSCNMVSRALSATPDAFGVSSLSTTAGVYSESLQYANPSGDMYLTKLEKRLLGITTSYIGYIRPIIGVHDD
jgi:hypothetical protein